jgi:hypothetical protein
MGNTHLDSPHKVVGGLPARLYKRGQRTTVRFSNICDTENERYLPEDWAIWLLN